MTLIPLRANLNLFLRHPWQLALSILGIALGVAVVVSIDLARSSAEHAFARSTEAVVGRASHRIVGGPAGVDEAVYTALRVEKGMRDSAPVIQGYLVAKHGDQARTLSLLGIDVFADGVFRDTGALSGEGGEARSFLREFLTAPNAVAMHASTAAALALDRGAGQTLQVSIGKRRTELAVIRLFSEADGAWTRGMENVLISDIATAQELLGMQGRLSHIDLRFDQGPGTEQQLAAISRLLGDDMEIVEAASRSQSIGQMTRAFHTNLGALSLLALLVGMFLVYNTMTFMVLKRRAVFGIFRTLGLTRRELFSLVLFEALLIGLVAVLIGIPAGTALARGLLQMTSRTINDLYYLLPAAELSLSSASWLKGIGLGLLATVCAAAAPALEATRVSPRQAMSRADLESRSAGLVKKAAVAGVLALLCGALVIWVSGKSIVAGFFGIFVIILGCVLLSPACTVFLLMLARLLLGHLLGVTARNMLRTISASLSRTMVAVSALMVAFATVIGIGLMINSFRGSVEDWLNNLLQADLYISTPGPVSAGSHYDLDERLAAQIRGLAPVRALSTVQNVKVQSKRGMQQLAAYESTAESWRGFHFIKGDGARIRDGFDSGDRVIVSEPYAWRHGVGVDDSLELRTDRGYRQFSIVGVFRDYRSEQGVIAMSRQTYNRHWQDRGYSGFGVYLKDMADANAAGEAIQGLNPQQSLWIEDRQGIFTRSLEIFDRTFAVTGVLRILAAVIAFLGLFSALMALQLERSREFAIYRALGYLPRQLWAMVVTESATLGLLAGLLAIPVGCLITVLLVTIINRRSFGWSMGLDFNPEIMLQGLLLAFVAALLAGVYPAWRISRTNVAAGLRGE